MASLIRQLRRARSRYQVGLDAGGQDGLIGALVLYGLPIPVAAARALTFRAIALEVPGGPSTASPASG